MKTESTGDIINLGFPIALLIIAIFSFFWFWLEIKKKRIQLNTMVVWLILNIIYVLIIIYITIIEGLHLANIDALNIFNWIAFNWFGINLANGKEWIILLIFMFISYILIKSLYNSIKISKLQTELHTLSREVAILSGKVNNTLEYKPKDYVSEKTYKEAKKDIKEKLKIAKLEVETKKKIAEMLYKDEKQSKKKQSK